MARHRGPRTAQYRPPGDHRAHQLHRRHPRHDRQGSYQRYRGRRGARSRRGVDLLDVKLRPEPGDHRVRSEDRHQRRRQRPARRHRQSAQSAHRQQLQAANHRQGRCQRRRHHASGGDLVDHVDPGPDPGRQRRHRHAARRRRRRRRRAGLRRPQPDRPDHHRPQRAGRAWPDHRRPQFGARQRHARRAGRHDFGRQPHAARARRRQRQVRRRDRQHPDQSADQDFGCRRCRLRPCGQDHLAAHQRPDRRRPRHRASGTRQHARHLGGSAQGDRGDEGARCRPAST